MAATQECPRRSIAGWRVLRKVSGKLFTYVAVDQQGMRKTGVIDALSERQARDRLAGQGLLVEALQEGQASTTERSVLIKHVAAPLFMRVNLEALQRFFAQLHSMHKAGVPLVQSLDTLAESERHVNLRGIIRDIRAHVLEGKPMSEAMEKYPEVFTPLIISLIRVGEHGGVLESSLKQVSEYLRKEIRLRNKIKTATFYPKLLLFMLIALPLATNFIIEIIASKTGGPRFTIMTIVDSTIFWSCVGLAIFFWWLFPLALQMPGIRQAWDSMLLRLPYIGGTVKMIAMAKFSRAMSALYGGGVPIAQSVEMSAAACGNTAVGAKIVPASLRIQSGEGIGSSLASTGAFTRVVLDMAYTGERTGNLEVMFDSVAEQYEDEADVRMEKMVKIMPVVLIVIAGVVVAIIVANFFLNYFNTLLNSS